MPYLQLDVNASYAIEDKKRFAQVTAQTCEKILRTDMAHVNVAIRELGEGNLWRTINGTLQAVNVLSCDIRDTQHTESKRLELTNALCQHCADILHIPQPQLSIIFTLHEHAQMYHPALGPLDLEWSMRTHNSGN